MIGTTLRTNLHKIAPALVGTFFTVFLAAENVGEDITAVEIISVVFILWLAAFIAWHLLAITLRDRRSISLLLTVGLTAIFFYGYVLDYLVDVDLVVISISRAVPYGLLVGAILAYIRWRRIGG
ncbi:MAG: hypothetical protein IH960_13165, partial [Chloroflexi bacterium]|nr:hypothetical protein [Chloroflexota bacterium]